MIRSARRVLGALTLCVAVAVPGTAQATFPGANGKIAFVSNRDGNQEIYTMNSDGSDQQNITNRPGRSDFDPAWSADGSMIIFTSHRAGGDNLPDALFVMNADGSGLRQVNDGRFSGEVQPNLAADGWRVVHTATPGTFNQLMRTDLYGSNLGVIAVPGNEASWAPAGESIAYSRGGGGLGLVNWDGSGLVNLTTGNDGYPDWAPDGDSILFQHGQSGSADESGLYTIDPDAPTPVRLAGTLAADGQPTWAPDGSRIAFVNTSGFNGDIYTADPDGFNRVQLTSSTGNDKSPAWQPLNPQPVTPYPRPKGATPLRASLVPAYLACENPNLTHGPSLAMPSCSPPKQTSDYLTVGTSDYNGAPAQSVGSLQLDALPGNPATIADEADVRLRASITDVRCKIAFPPCTGGSGSDYTGELQGNTALRITDRDNYPIPLDSATAEVWGLPFTIPCATTANTGIGSSCSVDTTVDAITPNTIREGMRSVWELRQIEVRDGGADGENDTDDYMIFAVQGIFVP